MREDLENPIVGALNTRPKYVASNTLTDAQWADTTVLSGDVATAIGELKAKPPAEAGDVADALGDRPGSSRMAKTYPRRERETRSEPRLAPDQGV